MLQPTPAAPPAGSSATRARIAETAQRFETAFLSQMLGQMFQGVGEDSEFTGGHGEAAFRSFLTDAMAQGMSRAGGVGLASSVQREMLRMQGLS
jgi:Rod binding domain-containing protein